MNNNDVSVGEFFKEYSELSSRAHGFVDETSHDDDKVDEEEMRGVNAEDEKKEEIPTYFQVVIKVSSLPNFLEFEFSNGLLSSFYSSLRHIPQGSANG